MAVKRRWVTMADVAKHAKVGTITVSRVLRTPEKVSPSTRARVTAAIETLGYVPDESAGGLSSRSTRIVGALISTVGGGTFASTLEGLSTTLRKAGLHLLVAGTDYSVEKEEDYISAMLARRPDGLVLSESVHSEKAGRLLARAEIPVVEVWDLPELPVCHAVGFSNFDAAFAMVRHLYETGRRQIGLIGNVGGSDRRVRQRVAGYLRALEVFGLGEPRIVASDRGPGNAVERGAAELGEMLARWPRTDAVFCVNDYLAVGAVCEARRRDLSVPDRLAVSGFGDLDVAADAGLGLTTIHVPGLVIGRLAAEMLLDALAGRLTEPRVTDIGFGVVIRGTT